MIKCPSSHEKSQTLLIKIDETTSSDLIYPKDKEEVNTTNFILHWKTKYQAIGYEVQVEDKNGVTVLDKTVTYASFHVTNEFKLNNSYSLRIRTKYPNDTWGIWSEKYSFSITLPKTP